MLLFSWLSQCLTLNYYLQSKLQFIIFVYNALPNHSPVLFYLFYPLVLRWPLPSSWYRKCSQGVLCFSTHHGNNRVKTSSSCYFDNITFPTVLDNLRHLPVSAVLPNNCVQKCLWAITLLTSLKHPVQKCTPTLSGHMGPRIPGVAEICHLLYKLSLQQRICWFT